MATRKEHQEETSLLSTPEALRTTDAYASTISPAKLGRVEDSNGDSLLQGYPSAKQVLRPKRLDVELKNLEAHETDGEDSDGSGEGSETSTSTQQQLDKLYGLIQTKTGSLGGGGSGGEIYGELTQASFHKIITVLKQRCKLNRDSVFLDIGSGLGKPNFHVAIDPGVHMSLGIEIQGSRWWQSMTLLYAMLRADHLQYPCKNVYFRHTNVKDMDTFDPVTHVYCFNRGMPFQVMKMIATLFNSSETAEYFICFDQMRKVEKCGFHVTLVDSSVGGVMHGSRERHKCYIYKKRGSKMRAKKKPGFHYGEQKSLVKFDDFSTWVKLAPPSEARYAPCVPHADSYSKGLVPTEVTVKRYREWVWEQIGLDRSKRLLRSRNQ